MRSLDLWSLIEGPLVAQGSSRSPWDWRLHQPGQPPAARRWVNRLQVYRLREQEIEILTVFEGHQLLRLDPPE
jgi:hypothetical protein